MSGASKMASTPDPSDDEVLWTLVDDPEDDVPEWPNPGPGHGFGDRPGDQSGGEAFGR